MTGTGRRSSRWRVGEGCLRPLQEVQLLRNGQPAEGFIRLPKRGTWCLERSLNPSGSRSSQFGEFVGFEFAPVADSEISESHIADACAHQFQDFAIDGFDHAAHLTVAAFGDGDFEM